MNAIPTTTFRGITINGALFTSAVAELASAQKELTIATAAKKIASLSTVASDASVTLAIISEAAVAATATDSSAVASATAAILSLMYNTSVLYYGYVPSLPGNLLMLIIMGLVLAIQTFYAVKYRQYWYGTYFCVGIALEFAGFVARVVSHFQPFNQGAYMCQTMCFTMSARFILGLFYYILEKLIVVYGQQFSVLKPTHYLYIFTFSDILFFVLQVTGSATAGSVVSKMSSSHALTYVMLAGLASQLFSISVFIVLGLIFFWRVYKASKLAEPGFDPKYEYLRSTYTFKAFQHYALVGIICGFVRSVYRVVELSEGWTGYLKVTEPYFLVLDGAMIAITGIVMSLPSAYPGIVVGSDVPIRKYNKRVVSSLEGGIENSSDLEEFSKESISN
ncbi:hypothetical protein BABINDRAFT_160377 [Babjeviella inositovora NRRL Y-12698]|uniref:Sphingoid long-chain base transporter RSB1 n=1 Tax=Babjeviella inositovora NRRL Y-12698 TaxID=984486 RepID=A0A1E3QTF5_9ASCO|nr:uncharacterized protein BABINDRAFT_160377 [Babjeviella inositovora NRRL Y-12698]ODQ80940.1 hypothetical protein BABINDRAFT_160377 [Babjeviella inositovora NRRL Y-12698]